MKVRTSGLEIGTGQGVLSRAGAGGCHQGAEQSRLEGWERLDVQKQKAGMGIEANASGPAPAWGSPAPRPGGKLPGWTGLVWAAGPSQLPAQKGFGAVRGPGRPASRPPSSLPRTSVSAGRRAGHARRSCRYLRPCRKPPPLPPTSGPVSSAAPWFARSGPVQPLLALPNPSEPPPPPQLGPSPHPSPA